MPGLRSASRGARIARCGRNWRDRGVIARLVGRAPSRFLAAALILFAGAVPGLVAAPELTAEEQRTIQLFEQASPAVVFITSVSLQRDFWSPRVMEIPRGTGSGFVWDDRGHVITNFHVIQGASKARVTLADQSTWDASLVGAAPEKDLAVLRIEAPRSALFPIKRGHSGDLRVGQNVYAIGNPFGLDQTLTTGVISALGREIDSMTSIPIRDVIQTDAAINPGNSGGPLLNSSGQLIGVNTAIVSPSGTYAGIGFSIPVDAVEWVVPELIANGRLRRPVLGVELASSQVQRRLELEGPLVLNVQPGSGAERAGVRATRRDANGKLILGDVIIAVGDTQVRSPGDLTLALERKSAGEKIRISVIREDRIVDLDLRLDEPR